jgi:excisionase family DNA binding protein
MTYKKYRYMELIASDDRWLSVDQVGVVYLGIKQDTVCKWIREKEMLAHKIGRLWKFKKDEIDLWVCQENTREIARKCKR